MQNFDNSSNTNTSTSISNYHENNERVVNHSTNGLVHVPLSKAQVDLLQKQIRTFKRLQDIYVSSNIPKSLSNHPQQSQGSIETNSIVANQPIASTTIPTTIPMSMSIPSMNQVEGIQTIKPTTVTQTKSNSSQSRSSKSTSNTQSQGNWQCVSSLLVLGGIKLNEGMIGLCHSVS